MDGRKGVDERIDEGVHRWFGHVERMDKDSIAMKECVLVVAQWVGSRIDGLILLRTV